MRSFGLLCLLFLLTLPSAANAVQCSAGALFCLDLVPVPAVGDLRAVLELRAPISANGTSVTLDGRQRFRLVARIDSLPPATRFGGRVYVAWATSLSMDSVVRLGSVSAGTTDLGEIGFEQFRILISAETSALNRTRRGPLVLRGTSPSTRLLAHRDMTIPGALGFAPAAPTGAEHKHTAWPMPPMDPRQPPMAGMGALEPTTPPWLPSVTDSARIPHARPRELLRVRTGDTIQLTAGIVQRRIAGKTILMYGFNGQYPGPLIEVGQAATIYVDLRNQLDQPTTVHWHGVRLENQFDGVPHLTQELVAPGGRFLYKLDFPDAGIYWYHPHHREDQQQELGLYGNLLVNPRDSSYYSPAHQTELLMLDDLLIGDQGLIPFGRDTPTHALMGRFGNMLLINGEPSYRSTHVQRSVVRYFLTNVSNTRVYNVSFGEARMKLVGSDVGKFEREEWVESIVLAPAERYIVDVIYDQAGTHAITNRVRSLNHVTGTYYQQVDTLGSVEVRPGAALPDLRAPFGRLRANQDVVRDIDSYRADFTRPAQLELVLTMRTRGLAPAIAAMAAGFPVPIDWNDVMGMMNWASTGAEVTWILRDPATGRENMDVTWRFRRGERVRLRIFNDPNVFHAMSHPIHLHGQRMLVLSRNGVATANHAWKDTALVQAGETVELLVDLTNPGKWMLHCHVAEHLGSGMMMVFEVSPN